MVSKTQGKRRKQVDFCVTVAIGCPDCARRALKRLQRKFPSSRIEYELCEHCGAPHIIDVLSTTKRAIARQLKGLDFEFIEAV